MNDCMIYLIRYVNNISVECLIIVHLSFYPITCLFGDFELFSHTLEKG